MTPNPLPCQQPADGADADREIYCAHYSGCLDEAALYGWASFTCRGCKVRGTANVDPRVANRSFKPAAALRLVRAPVIYRHNGTSERVFALFAEDRTWTTPQVAERLGISSRAANDSLRVLVRRDRIRRISVGIFGRHE